MTVHRVIKRHGLLVRVRPKPQPSKRFQRYHVDSLWQGDIFEFRIAGVGKVYVTGFTDDRSRYRVRSRVYLHKNARESIDALRWALREGRAPREIYLDNGRQFVAKEFKREARRRGIKLIFGKPYHPRGRGKIESYHKTLWCELISQVRFTSLSHFKRELWRFDRRYNDWRKSQALGWKTPAEIYDDTRYFNRERRTGVTIFLTRFGDINYITPQLRITSAYFLCLFPELMPVKRDYPFRSHPSNGRPML